MITYRKAEPSDAGALLVHINKVGKETDFLSFEFFNISVEREAKFIERFSSSKKDVMLIALDGERVVGNGIIECEKIPRFSHRAELSITVLEEYWGRGIGTALIERLIAEATERRISVIDLNVRADNKRAISLYKKFGFEKVGVMKRFFYVKSSFYDALIMQLLLPI